MILYFSGTGNSAYVARKLGGYLHDEPIDLFQKIRDKDASLIESQKPWIIVSPTYAWRIPRILQEWLSKAELKGSKEIYFVMTCGGSIGNAEAYLKNLCTTKGLSFLGCMPIVMPENYIALYDAPNQEETLHIIEQAQRSIHNIADLISKKERYTSSQINMQDKMRSGIVNDLFYPTIVHAKKFYATNACITCGVCERVCPLENIKIEKGKPAWGKQCTHCMACINHCPKEAIEYGKRSIGKRRYTCPSDI